MGSLEKRGDFCLARARLHVFISRNFIPPVADPNSLVLEYTGIPSVSGTCFDIETPEPNIEPVFVLDIMVRIVRVPVKHDLA